MFFKGFYGDAWLEEPACTIDAGAIWHDMSLEVRNIVFM